MLRSYSPSEETARRQTAILRLLRLVEADSLLDVGCADGRATATYAQALGVELQAVAGVEPQEGYRKITGFQTVKTDIESEELPFGLESFDLVICNQVLEHLREIWLPLHQMARVTRVGGFLLIGVPNLASLMSRIYLSIGKDPICLRFPGPHLRGFTHRSFKRWLESNPSFSMAGITGSSFYPFPPRFFESLARLMPGLACYCFYLLRKKDNNPTNGWSDGGYLKADFTG